jgi:hypothetical protein
MDELTLELLTATELAECSTVFALHEKSLTILEFPGFKCIFMWASGREVISLQKADSLLVLVNGRESKNAYAS